MILNTNNRAVVFYFVLQSKCFPVAAEVRRLCFKRGVSGHQNLPRNSFDGGKAAEHSRTPKPCGIRMRLGRRASVWECGCALPLSSGTRLLKTLEPRYFCCYNF